MLQITRLTHLRGEIVDGYQLVDFPANGQPGWRVIAHDFEELINALEHSYNRIHGDADVRQGRCPYCRHIQQLPDDPHTGVDDRFGESPR